MMRLAMVLILLLGLGNDRLEQLAQQGKIQEDAPVKASSEISISAEPEQVWALLTDVNDWPKWQSDITKAEIHGPLQPGTEFTWTSGTQIRSRIALVQPPQVLAWTGQAYKAKAIHVWRLESAPNGQTLVSTSESMDGFMLSVFYSSKKLKESQERWLKSLKAAAER
jgi:hypothetical protein